MEATPGSWPSRRDQDLFQDLPNVGDLDFDEEEEEDADRMDDGAWGEKVASLRLQVAQKGAEVERLKGGKDP